MSSDYADQRVEFKLIILLFFIVIKLNALLIMNFTANIYKVCMFGKI